MEKLNFKSKEKLFNTFEFSHNVRKLFSSVTSITEDLNSQFITGLADAESTFTISITKDNREIKTNRRLLNNIDQEIFSIHPSFAISVNFKDYDLINKLHSYFGVGKIKN
uniref:Endonuclease n=1 Tax=Orbilia oligospora TaxID=2813651 RepID=A0A6G6A4W8_ORBOL|nr:endonuclease [Orbilia oligospora]